MSSNIRLQKNFSNAVIVLPPKQLISSFAKIIVPGKATLTIPEELYVQMPELLLHKAKAFMHEIERRRYIN